MVEKMGENVSNKALDVKKVEIETQQQERKLREDIFHQCEKDAIQLYHFLRAAPHLSSDNMSAVKDQDASKALARIDWPQVQDLIGRYNAEHKSSQNIIQEGQMKAFLEQFKSVFLVWEKHISTMPMEGESNKEKAQGVGEFLLSDEQKKRIVDDINLIKTNYTLNEVVLSGRAEGTIPNDLGKQKAKDFVANQLQILKNNWFDTTKLPSLEQEQELYAQQETDKPGNVAWAYGRAIMQISHLWKDQLALLKNVPVSLDLSFDTRKGNEYTQGAIQILWQAAKDKLIPLYAQKTEILRDRDVFQCFIKGYVKGKLSEFRVETTIDASSQNPALADVSLTENFYSEQNSGWVNLERVSAMAQNTKIKVIDNTLYLNIPATDEFTPLLQKGKKLSFADVYDIYIQLGWDKKLLEDKRAVYTKYQKLQTQIAQMEIVVQSGTHLLVDRQN